MMLLSNMLTPTPQGFLQFSVGYDTSQMKEQTQQNIGEHIG